MTFVSCEELICKSKDIFIIDRYEVRFLPLSISSSDPLTESKITLIMAKVSIRPRNVIALLTNEWPGVEDFEDVLKNVSLVRYAPHL